MEKSIFERELRTLLRQEPFQPFVVELENGSQIVVTQPSVAFNNGFAGYLNNGDELVEFSCNDVHQIH